MILILDAKTLHANSNPKYKIDYKHSNACETIEIHIRKNQLTQISFLNKKGRIKQGTLEQK